MFSSYQQTISKGEYFIYEKEIKRKNSDYDTKKRMQKCLKLYNFF